MIAVGCDWARKKHQFVVLSIANKELACFCIPHSAQGLAEAAKRLQALEPDAPQIRIAIEGHDGPLMDWLQDQSYTVIAVNPKTSHAARNLMSSSGSKDDVLDARALAQLVLLEAPRLAPRKPRQPHREVITLLLRQRERRVQEKSDLLPNLKQILQEWAPALAGLCDDLCLVWTRHLLESYPLEQDLHAAHPRTLRAFATKHRLRAQTVERILKVRKDVPLPIRPIRLDTLRQEIRYRLSCLDRVIEELDSLESQLAVLVQADAAHPVLATLPGASVVTEAAWLAAFDAASSGSPSWRSIATHAGLSPVTRASGSARGVTCRRSCDPMLKRLLTYHAFQTALVDGSWAQEVYRAKRACEKGHYTTLRGIAQRWVKIVNAMMRDHTAYAEHIHRDRRNDRSRKAA